MKSFASVLAIASATANVSASVENPCCVRVTQQYLGRFKYDYYSGMDLPNPCEFSDFKGLSYEKVTSASSCDAKGIYEHYHPPAPIAEQTFIDHNDEAESYERSRKQPALEECCVEIEEKQFMRLRNFYYYPKATIAGCGASSCMNIGNRRRYGLYKLSSCSKQGILNTPGMVRNGDGDSNGFFDYTSDAYASCPSARFDASAEEEEAEERM